MTKKEIFFFVLIGLALSLVLVAALSWVDHLAHEGIL